MRELALDKLDGTTVGPYTLDHTLERSRRPHPVAITATDGAVSWPILEGRTNPGTPWRWPWLEVRFEPRVPATSDGRNSRELSIEAQDALFAHLADALTPGAYVMLSCDGFTETNWELTIDVPPAATRLGELLWIAGARWYKVWYYPEGWREGHEKLQGNTPPNERHRERAEAERRAELEAWLDSGSSAGFPACRARAERLLDGLGQGPEHPPTREFK